MFIGNALDAISAHQSDGKKYLSLLNYSIRSLIAKVSRVDALHVQIANSSGWIKIVDFVSLSPSVSRMVIFKIGDLFISSCSLEDKRIEIERRGEV